MLTVVWRRFIALAPLTALPATACHALSDPGIEYGCFPPDTPYVEEFFPGDDFTPYRDLCWQDDNFENSVPQVNDGDLLIRPRAQARWEESGQAPMVFRRLEGEFLMAARVEAATGMTGGDHCLDAADAAGLVVRRTEPSLGWVTLTIRPSDATDACVDDAPDQTAIAETRSSGFESTAAGSVDGLGVDAEVDIAVCRSLGVLHYYYRDITRVLPEMSDEAWEEIPDVEMFVGEEPLDVGATTIRGGDVDVEGHFNWIVIRAEGGFLPSDGCAGELERLSEPLPEGN